MVQLSGIYNNGQITLEQNVSTSKPVKVMVTFMDEEVVVEEKRLTLDMFSFNKTRELLKNVHTSFSDAVIEERKTE
ncbi:hypothetical protein ACFQ3S_14155 [Mucilaginibacter terrae]|uniref:hypothetical protein n=1 Tax=Mucilaginibacter terrae TaxID=1955052 RepID=UPI00362AD30C